MIHPRILELLKTPADFSENDLPILEAEIRKYPYMQNIKALYLYGVHQYRQEHYASLLSKTAAYTTDKKILYQFINKNKTEEKRVENPVPVQEKIIPENHFAQTGEKKISKFDVEKTIESPVFGPSKPVYVNGELNRILFEGEENFLQNHSEKIDLEATMESGILVTSKQEKSDNKEFAESSDAENFSKELIINEEKTESQKNDIRNENEVSFHEIPEILVNNNSEIKETESTGNKFQETADAEDFSKEEIINENQISEEENIVDNSAELSFRGTEDFMPEIQLRPKDSPEKYEVPKTAPNRHEEEMKKLLAEVEAKMKSGKKPKTETDEEIPQNHDINFAETHDQPETETIEPETKTEEEKPQPEIPEIRETEENTSWKPMNFDSNIPDSVLDKEEEKSIEKEEISIDSGGNSIKNDELSSNQNTENPEISDSEIPVLNVSFLSDSESITPKAAETEKIENQVPESNVPQFINTWQNWLKIDRSTKSENEKSSPKPEKIKSQTIDKFIETEPKISQLKEESSFVVKEKPADISHLMTETLAKLYTEQKLYSKAIKAYETLKGKHPEKTEFFDGKIQEIKELKANGAK